MRRYRRIFLAVLFVMSALVWFVPEGERAINSWLQRYQQGSWQQFSDTVSSSLVYPLKPEEWLSFSIPPETQQLKIISNGHIQHPESVLPEDSWKYILHYQLIDKNGRILLDNQYHHKTRLTSYKNEEEKIFYGNYYSGYHYTPLDGRLMKLAREAIKNAVKVKIAFISQTPGLEEAAVRLYVPGKVSEHLLGTLWLRMNDKQKASLVKGSVYPSTLLTESEKRNLLKHQWQAVGPNGVEGRDYTSHTLYILKEIEHNKLGEQIVAAGLQIDPQHDGVIPIPEQGGKLTLHVLTLDGTDFDGSVDLDINWFGRLREQRWQTRRHWQPGDKLEFDVQGGLIKIASDQTFLLHATLESEAKERLDITPQALMITTYAADQGVNYEVFHVADKPTTIRLDVRRQFGELDVFQKETTIEYQWLNRQGQVVYQAVLPVDVLPSRYDRIKGGKQGERISDPLSYYFNIPANVTQLRISAKQQGFLVNAYNQPDRFQKQQRVPENSYVSDNKENWFPSWFMLRPANEQSLLKTQAVNKIAGQYRPHEKDTAIQANQYDWEDYLPLEKTEANYLLTETNSLEYRDQALANTYCLLAQDQLQRLNLKSYSRLTLVKPEMIYLRGQQDPFEVTVSADSLELINRQAIGKQGVMNIPGLTSGYHVLKVTDSGGASWLLNHVKDCSTKVYLKRRAFKFKKRRLTFMFKNEKSEDKVLSARFFAASGIDKRSVIEVNIEALAKKPAKRVQDSWTFSRRLFDIRPPQDNKSVILFQQNKRLNSGESFFIPFYKDMPEGDYRITMKLQQGAAGHLALSRVNPGRHEQYRFYRETYDQID